jgi:hypothetical protein
LAALQELSSLEEDLASTQQWDEVKQPYFSLILFDVL